MRNVRKLAAGAALTLALTAGAVLPASAAPTSTVGMEQEQKAPVGGYASGAVGMAVFYNWLTLNAEHRGSHYKLEGEGWGLGLAGGAGLSGDIYTDDMDRLLRDTVKYQMNNVGAYANVNFLDSSGNNLGSLHSGAAGIAAGIFEGWGSWRKI